MKTLALALVLLIYRPDVRVAALDAARVVHEGDAWFLDVRGRLQGDGHRLAQLLARPTETALVAVPAPRFRPLCENYAHAYRMAIALPQESQWPLDMHGGASLLMDDVADFSARLRLPARLAGFSAKALLRLEWDGEPGTVGASLPLVLVWDRASGAWAVQYGPAAELSEGPAKKAIRITRFGIPVDTLAPREVTLLATAETSPTLRIEGTYVPRTCGAETESAPIAAQYLRETLGLASLHRGDTLDLWGTGCRAAGGPVPIGLEARVQLGQSGGILNLLAGERAAFLVISRPAGGAWRMRRDSVRACFP